MWTPENLKCDNWLNFPFGDLWLVACGHVWYSASVEPLHPAKRACNRLCFSWEAPRVRFARGRDTRSCKDGQAGLQTCRADPLQHYTYRSCANALSVIAIDGRVRPTCDDVAQVISTLMVFEMCAEIFSWFCFVFFLQILTWLYVIPVTVV